MYTKELRPRGNFKMSDFLGQYSKLWDYAEELKKTNLGSIVVIDTKLMPNDKTKFKRIYICFNAGKQGWWHGCRKIIRLHACHMKSYHKAQLLCAIGIDADNWYYPIAYAVVEKEWEVLEAISSPIYSLLEMLRIKIMNRRASRRADLKMWYQDIDPKILEVLDLEAKKSRNFVVYWRGQGHYQVSINQTPIAMVNLKEKIASAESGISLGYPVNMQLQPSIVNMKIQ
ncbi:hypothetical protein LWI28_014016 [Acer negundo]|uniref:Uncharacterized protein n=1 Tax=Acer negundo TaxID=4023 RepID=A0AAD5P223_ACENE|nr:hypothetical protein LWI28_014016 [Acer negundo]